MEHDFIKKLNVETLFPFENNFINQTIILKTKNALIFLLNNYKFNPLGVIIF
jgi:hypothetical protein